MKLSTVTTTPLLLAATLLPVTPALAAPLHLTLNIDLEKTMPINDICEGYDWLCDENGHPYRGGGGGAAYVPSSYISAASLTSKSPPSIRALTTPPGAPDEGLGPADGLGVQFMRAIDGRFGASGVNEYCMAYPDRWECWCVGKHRECSCSFYPYYPGFKG
ncbi:hypothetical protein EX30DRAFT_120749 [Ascodesmis nigricans]|uniref:Uncharacterized protein n=1 Tax=Ascodesmis nigricans TaxID=341454 RepID=A0A4S2MPB3_9PEZI|nr:hypothetical protein EX30DRAFT_120749 [Ascodesmis nigricans]